MAHQLPIDLRRVAILAMLSALDDLTAPPQPARRRRLGSKRALLVGAGLVTAGRVMVAPRARDLLERLAATDGEWDPVEDDDELEEDDESTAGDDDDGDDSADDDEDEVHAGAGTSRRGRL